MARSPNHNWGFRDVIKDFYMQSNVAVKPYKNTKALTSNKPLIFCYKLMQWQILLLFFLGNRQ